MVVNSIVVLMFLLPVLRQFIKNKLFRNFSLDSLTRTFNKALILQIVIGAIFSLISLILYNVFYTVGESNSFTLILMEATVNFLIIGLYIYLPILVLLNVVNRGIKKLSKSS
jgi:hypothetical protein